MHCNNICAACETVAHCSRSGCIPLTPAEPAEPRDRLIALAETLKKPPHNLSPHAAYAVAQTAVAALSQPHATAQEAAPCTFCNGRGFYGIPGQRCSLCDGTGRAPHATAPIPPLQGAEAVAYMKAGANPWHGYEACASDDPNGFPVYRAAIQSQGAKP